MFCRRHMHSSECCHYFSYVNHCRDLAMLIIPVWKRCCQILTLLSRRHPCSQTHQFFFFFFCKMQVLLTVKSFKFCSIRKHAGHKFYGSLSCKIWKSLKFQWKETRERLEKKRRTVRKSKRLVPTLWHMFCITMAHVPMNPAVCSDINLMGNS